MSATTIPLPRKDGLIYLAEGGIETEIMYRHGHPLREFAMFELLDTPQAVIDLKDMYRRYLDVAATWGMGALLAGLDYRASPDWGSKLGYSAEALADIQHRCIDFLREVSAPYADQLPSIVVCGCVGPRGDAYSLNEDITEESKMEAALSRAQHFETLGQIAGRVAHDFNNLLTIVRSAAEFALMTQDNSEEILGEVIKASERGANLTAQMLSYAGAQVLKPKVKKTG